MTEEEHLGMDVATFAIVEHVLLIAERMKKKRRQMTKKYLRYVEEEGIPMEKD